jgi:uncharacterized protein (TIGR03790 family)
MSNGMKVVSVLSWCFLVWSVSPAFGLEPKEILVVANRNMEGSVDLAHYYMDRRRIPKINLLVLSLTVKETMSRKEYNQMLKKKVFDTLEALGAKNRIEAIVLMYGVPLKIAPPRPDRETVERVKRQENNNQSQQQERAKLQEKQENIHMRAAVDSELALVRAGDYDLDGWVKNPYFLGFKGADLLLGKNQVLLVSRLDGPDTATVKRIIDDSLQVEKTGLDGKAYFDARWPENAQKNLSGYKLYDQSIHRAAALVQDRMEVLVDEQEGLFPPKSCPDAALYCGWYSLASYIDSFTWRKGAIGYHIASAECSSFKETTRPLWCLKMLEKGVAATVGPVYEPYVEGFPLPELFFGTLAEGYLSLGESYLVSLPFLSWQMILIGDPLYQPFAPQP